MFAYGKRRGCRRRTTERVQPCEVAPVARRPGRPPAEDPRNRVISVRLTQGEYEAVKDAANRYDLPLSEWCRARLVAAARRARG